MKASWWCRCGASLTITAPSAWLFTAGGDTLRGLHAGPECELTEDPAVARRWRAAQRARERKERRS